MVDLVVLVFAFNSLSDDGIRDTAVVVVSFKQKTAYEMRSIALTL